MNMLFRNKIVGIVFAILTVYVGGVYVSSLGPDQINPNKDKLLSPDEGKKYAAVYNISDLYTATDENDDVLRNIQTDLVTFARSTRPEFADADTLVGFTFDKKSGKEGETSVYSGYFYGLNDKIQVKLTPHGRGVYTLSITNLKDNTNVDDELSMNGKRNHYIVTLPIEKPNYSIRYQNKQDRILVSFYDGYTLQDVDEAVGSITAGLGEEADKNVAYNINRIGFVSLEKVRENLVNPIPTP